MSFLPDFPGDGVITVNRVELKPEYSVDDLEERVALLCENVKTYHSETGFHGGFVCLNSGRISNEGSTVGQAVESPMKDREALIVTFWSSFEQLHAEAARYGTALTAQNLGRGDVTRTSRIETDRATRTRGAAPLA